MASTQGARAATPVRAPSGDGTAERGTPSTTGLVLLVLILGSLTYSLLQSMITPALPTIADELHTSTDTVTWLMTGYLLCASVTTPILGRLGDMVGKKKMFMAAVAALGLGSLICGLATSVDLMIVGRVVQGFGAAIFPLSYGIVRDEFPVERRATAIGLVSAIMGIGGGVGIVLTGPIVEHLSYHWLFWIPMIVCAVSFAAAWFLVPESPVRQKGRVNWLGALLLSGGLVCLLLALSKGQDWGWGAPLTVSLLVGSVVLLAAWVWVEVRASQPLVDMQVMRLRGVWTTNLASLLSGYAMIGAMLLVPQFLQTPKDTGYGFGASITKSGVYMLPLALAMLIGGPLSGALDRRVGSKPSMLGGCGFIAAGYVVLVAAHSQSWQILLAVFVIGIGVGMAFAAMANLIVAAVPVEQTGIASGINTISRTVGMSLGTTLSTLALTSNTRADGLPTEHGYTLAFLFAGVAGALGLLVSLLIPSHRKETALHPVS